MLVPFTQRPHGRKHESGIDRPAYIADAAYRFIDAGGAFSCEILPIGDVALWAEYNGQDILCRTAPNGPSLMQAVDQLILNAAAIICKQAHPPALGS